MSGNESPQSVIKKFEKRQKMMPYFLGALAGILALAGIFIIIAVASGSKNIFGGLFSTKTPTATMTYTPTATQPSPTPSNTPTITETPSPSVTSTFSGPFQYTVLQDDTCWDIAVKYDADINYLMEMNNFVDGVCDIVPGKVIWIPAPGQELPTPTPLPSDIARGTIIEYKVREGDTLAIIASYLNSTVDDIITRNSITDQNTIYPGQVLKVKVYIVTPTNTLQATSTLQYTLTPGLPGTTPTK